jgi:AcrR family transcriptional regulator
VARDVAYTRLDVDERRRRLLGLGRRLFTRHAYDELSMAAIAREAGISKALLYHYFPSKQAYFAATLHQAAAEVAGRVTPPPGGAPAEQLRAALDAWLEWIDDNRVAYAKLMRSATAHPETRELVDGVRDTTSAAIVTALHGEGDPPPRLRAAVRGWLWFVDGACLDRLEHGDVARAELRELLAGTLAGAADAAGCADVAARLRA